MPTTPPPIREPEFPVTKENSFPPLPKSSAFDLTIIDLPIIEWGPINLTWRSSIPIFAIPSSSASILPNKISVRIRKEKYY